MRDTIFRNVASDEATLESWSRYLDEHPAPLVPVQFDMLAATGPWAWWAVGVSCLSFSGNVVSP
jgi:hypothetical protein